jgi:hypothetical protein
MKHLLTGVAMAAALAIAAPVWAQNAPMTPSSPPAAAAPSSSTPMASKPMAKKPMHRMSHRGMGKGMMGQGDQMTEQLNQQELQRIQGGNMSAPPAPGGGMPPMGGNAPTSGMGSPMAPSGGMSAPPPPPK